MEHIIIIELNDGYKLIKPEDGYRLYNTVTQRYYSVAEVKDVRPYIAVKDKIDV